MTKIDDIINRTLIATKGYISPVTETLLWHYVSGFPGYSIAVLKEILNEKIENFREVSVCPNCGAKHFSIHRICDTCNYPYPETSELKMSNLISEMEDSLSIIKSFPKPTIYSILKTQAHIIFPLLTIYSLIMALLISRSDSEFFAILSPFYLMFAFLSIVAFKFRKKNKETHNFERKVQLQRFTNNAILAKRHYGNHEKVKQIITNYEQILNNQTQQEKSKPVKKAIGYGMLAILMITILIISPKSTYSEIEVKKSKKMASKLMKMNQTKLIVQPLTTKVIGNFNEYFEIEKNPVTFHIEVNPTSSIRPETYFTIKGFVGFKIVKPTPVLSGTNSFKKLRIEILDENKNPIFVTFYIEPLNFEWDFKSSESNFKIEFLGVDCVQSTSEANWIYNQKDYIMKAKYFVIYGDYWLY